MTVDERKAGQDAKSRIAARSASIPPWRREISFLLERLGAAGRVTAPKAVSDDFNWDYLLSVASLHGVLPLLGRSVSTSGPGIPDSAMERMRRDLGAIARRNFIFAQEMLRVVAHLRHHQIGVVPYKGAVLAEIAYGDLSLRQYSDLDLLVRPEEVMKARHLLEEQGYRTRFVYSRQPLSKLTVAQTDRVLTYYHEFELQRKDGLLIDLHWQLAPRHFPFRLDPGPLWARLAAIEIEGRSIPTFGDEDLVLILCLHGAKDQWKKLIWIVDLAQVLRNKRALDWDLVFSRARSARMELPLLLGLRLADELFAVGSPADAEPGHRRQVDGLARTVFAKLFRNVDRPERFPVKSLHVKLCRTFGDKLRYTCRAFFIPRVEDWAVIRLPAWLYPAYYVLRPIRVLAGAAWRLVRGARARQ